MKNKKSQSAIEFVLLISFMIVVFFGFFFAIQSQITDVTNKQKMQTLEEANNLVKTNIELARQSYPDFSNKFILPDLGNTIYQVTIEENNTLVSKIDDKEYIDFLQYEIKGELKTGSKYENIIYHNDGIFLDKNLNIISNNKANGLFININSEVCAKHELEGDCDTLTEYTECKNIGVCT